MIAEGTRYTRDDLNDLSLLAAVGRAERLGRRVQPRDLAGDKGPRADARLRRLLERCLLVSAPRSPVGVSVGVIGQARLHRFVRSPIGSARPAAHLGEECALRRIALEALATADCDEILAATCRDLVAMRDGVLSCAFAEACRSGACPLAAASQVEEIDLALLWLSGVNEGQPVRDHG